MTEYQHGSRAEITIERGDWGDRGIEKQRQCSRALDVLLEVKGGHIALADLENEVGAFAPATLSMIRAADRLRKDPHYKKYIHWVIEGEFPFMRKNPQHFHIHVEDRAGLSVVMVDDHFQKEMERERPGMHGMVVRRDSSNPWSGMTVLVNGSSPKHREILRHEAMHLLYSKTFDRYVGGDMSEPMIR